MDTESKTNRRTLIIVAVGGTIGFLVGIALVATFGPGGRTPQPVAEPGTGKVEHVGVDAFEQKVLLSKTPVLVDFFAEWCPPCKRLAPVLEEAAREMPGAKIMKVNVDENPELARKYEVRSIPTLILFRDGKPVERHTGPLDKVGVQQLLAK